MTSSLNAIFTLVEVPIDTINTILSEAHKATEFAKDPLWLASDDYSDVPKKVQGVATKGTKPPISSSYKSPWVGKKVEDVAGWLKNKPEEADIDINFFAVLDKSAMKGEVVICRIGGPELKDMEKLHLLRLKAYEAVQQIYVAQFGNWEDEEERSGRAEIEY